MMNNIIIFFLSIIGISMYIIIKNVNPIYSVLNLIIIFWCYACILIILDMEFLACIFILVNVGAVAVLFLFIIMMININIVEIKDNLKKYYPFLIFLTLNVIGLISLIVFRYKMKVPLNEIEFSKQIYLELLNSTLMQNTINTIQFREITDINNVLNNINNLQSSIFEKIQSNKYSLFLSLSIVPFINTNKTIELINVIKKDAINSIEFVQYENIYEKFIQTTDIKHIGSNLLYASNSIWFILACLILLVAMVGVIYITEELLIKRKLEGNKSQDLFEQISKDYIGNIKFYDVKSTKKRGSIQ
uniref:NADH-ubiquinone oxidoreductase chain 6 n=1 Tax=Heterostelium pallidum TaxID=13642 RepID=Q5ILI4_HETPA|nr:NADH dehydrogenase subunit 6 [Heterostelium pallidum]AAU00626.1 NADH dehydrogenase subunit 6 [Heterostelium pallidum]